MNDEDLVRAVLKKWKPDGGSADEDLRHFALTVLTERRRRDNREQARETCLAGGGHFFSFLSGSLAGEWYSDINKTTISGWQGCDLKCDSCDAWLSIQYPEIEL